MGRLARRRALSAVVLGPDDNVTSRWWSISEADMMQMLREVKRGESVDEVYMRWYANSTVEHIDDPDDPA